ncbi:hypothetical protein [Kitasatospora sp. NPDC096204]|uniref:hypothetical protein n=1 Tax=Kitasatospora sp. NPDC096204 TaxID=3364094 RepID=UPI0037F81D75
MSSMTLSRSNASAMGATGASIAVHTIRTDNLLMLHHTMESGAEYWDIAYASNCGDDDVMELVDLEALLLQRYGRRLDELVVERLNVARPHPRFAGSSAFTYVRIDPSKVV